MGFGALFEDLADETATFTYAHRIWQFFKGLFKISFSKIFELFEIEDDFQSFFDTLNQSVSRFAPMQGCETWVPYCQANDISVLARGPLAKGVLSGKYTAKTIFTDSVRAKIHKEEKRQEKFEANVAIVEKIKSAVKPAENMAATALRYIISHPVEPIAIPGAKSPEQAAMNARAGEKIFSDEERDKLIRLL